MEEKHSLRKQTSPERAEQSLLHTLELARTTDALQKAVLERHRAEKVRTVLGVIGEQLNTATTPDQAAQVILDAADELFGWDAALVDVYDTDRNVFYAVARFDTISGKRMCIKPPASGVPLTPLRKQLFEEGPLLILRREDSQLTQERLVSFGSKSRKSASLMFVPINKGNRRAGILSVQSYTPEAYDERDLELLRILADYCCTGLERTFADMRAHEAERTLRLLLSIAPVFVFRTDRQCALTSFAIGRSSSSNCDYLGHQVANAFRKPGFTSACRSAMAGKDGRGVVEVNGIRYDYTITAVTDSAGNITGCEGAGYEISK